MTRKLIVALSVAALLVFTLSAAAMAAGRARTWMHRRNSGIGLERQRRAAALWSRRRRVCDNFVDEDGDGINDWRPRLASTGRRAGCGRMAQAQSNARGFRFDDAAPGGAFQPVGPAMALACRARREADGAGSNAHSLASTLPSQ